MSAHFSHSENEIKRVINDVKLKILHQNEKATTEYIS